MSQKFETISRHPGGVPQPGFDTNDKGLRHAAVLAGRQAKPSTPAEMQWALSYIVEADYLKVMGIPLRRGRFLNSTRP